MTASMETPRDMALNRSLPDVLIEPVVRMALAEDLGRAGDVTALACIPPGARMKAAFTARKAGVLAGIQAVRLAWPVVKIMLLAMLSASAAGHH